MLDVLPLAVLLAEERFRQQALAETLNGPGTDPNLVSHDFGGELWLHLTSRACEQIAEARQDGQSTAEAIDAIQRDLTRACHLTIERDRQGAGLALRIYSNDWILIVLPDCQVWNVVAIIPRTYEFRATLTGLPWRLIRSVDEATGIRPLPLWLLGQAQLRGPVQQRYRKLRNPERPTDERAETIRLLQMQNKLPDAVEDLCSAFRLLQWERQRRDRLSWTLTLAPLDEGANTSRRCGYVIEHGKPDAWPQRSVRFALGLEPHARWVLCGPDPESPSRWLLHGPPELPGELTIYELAEDDYRRQARIATRLSAPSKIQPEDASTAATQINLSSTAEPKPDFHPLPGEVPWEPRQEEALRLALAGHVVCAIKGPPGTGKSTVIVGLIRRAIHAGQRVLLVAPTHVALDEVLGRVHALRMADLDQTVVPARVAPADEGRAQIKPELEQYIARHLGASLARKAQQNIRAQKAALTPDDALQKTVLQHGATLAQLRVLASARTAHAHAQHALGASRSALETAKQLTEERHTVLREAGATLDTLRQHSSRLSDAARQFADIEDHFLQTRHALAAAEQQVRAQEAAAERVRSSAEVAERRLKQAASVLRRARRRVERRRPTGKISHLIERVFSLHARAVQAVADAEAHLDTSQRDRDAVRQSAVTAEDDLRAAEWTLGQAQHAATAVRDQATDQLLPAREALATALGGDLDEWLSSLPNSLRRALETISENVALSTRAKAEAEKSWEQAENAVRAAYSSFQAAEVATESAGSELLARERTLHDLGIVAEADIGHQIAEVENQQAATARDLERTGRRRQLLQRWQEFYEHDDGDDQLAAWAVTSVNLVAATTQGIAGSKEFSDNYFDLLICDESSRVTRGEVLVPADRAERVVLVGDEKQLPPYVEADDEQLIQALATIQVSDSRADALPDMALRLCDAWNVDEPEFRPVRVEEVCERARLLMAEGNLPEWPEDTTGMASVDERLRAWRTIADALTTSCFDHVLGILPADRVVRLSVQRRMVPEIAALVSAPVYNGDYRSSDVSPVTPVLTETFRHPWTFVNTRSYCAARPEFRERNHGTGFVNEGEARAVIVALMQHVLTARRTGTPVTLMVITFYLAQARLIESYVRHDRELRGARIAILPIDRCQGQEADVVVVSFVRTLPRPRPNAGRWLQDVRRLNVALTRARRGLVLIGNLQTLTSLRGDPDGESLLAHLGRCVAEQPDHQIEQLHGL